jgi:phage-related baseplate assembly protein
MRDARDTEDLLGLDLVRSWIAKAAMVAGVSNVNILQPAEDVSAVQYEAIKIGDVSVAFAGRGR